MITTFQLARTIRNDLREGDIAVVGRNPYQLTGRLDTGAVIVGIEILIPQDLSVLKQFPPNVLCRESWMREGAEWHNDRRSGMCWILQQLWCDVMNWEGKPALSVLSDSRALLLDGVRCLINRHYAAHLEGLRRWPKEWDFWAHGEKGAWEYEREKPRQSNL